MELMLLKDFENLHSKQTINGKLVNTNKNE